MKSVTAREAKNRFGEVLEAAQRQPVSITRNGRPSVVIIPAESYAHRNAPQLVDAVLDRDIDILTPELTFGELVSRLDRPKFDRYHETETWKAFLPALVELTLWHEDAGKAAGWADAIVSGDGDLLELVTHEGIPVVTPAQFLLRVRESEA